MKKRPLILASASPRRRLLLRELGRPFRVIPSRILESSRSLDPRLMVQDLALRKAWAVAGKVARGTVIGADTVVVLRGKVLGKPDNPRHAEEILGALAGSRHQVYTGVAVVDAANGKTAAAFAESTVLMRKLDRATLRRLSRRHVDKAGAYAIQEKRDPIAKVVKGSYDNVVGLPVALVRKLLRQVEGRP